MIAIFRGDDTAFAGANSVRVTIGTSVSLAGCRAEFNLCGVVKQIPDASTGTFTVAFTAEETAAMPLGVQCATVRVFDSQGRVRTASNTVRVLVTDRVEEAYRNANAVEVSLASPGGIIDDGGGVPADLAEDYTPDEMRTFLNRLAALMRNSMAVIAAMLILPISAQDWTNRVSKVRFGAFNSMSNVVTSVDLSGFIQAETDPTVPAWAKSETPPASMSTNTVCYIVTNDVPVSGEFTSWKIESPTGSALPSGLAVVWGYFPGIMDYAEPYTGWYLEYNGQPNDSLIRPYAEDISATNLISAGDGGYAIIATRQQVTRNALGLAKASDVEAVASEAHAATVTNAAQASTLSNHSSRLSQLTQTVGTWETYWDGDEVRVTVTNYDSSVHLPSLYLEQKLENTNAYRVVWDERTRWASNDVQMAAINAAIDEKADRAWGFYDSHTGYYAPDGYTWLSSPKIAIAGGLAYQRTLTNDGAIWVLVSNGMVAETGGTMTNGFFRIKDDEGNTTFEIVRGNKRTVGATAAGIKVTTPRNSPTTTIEIPYNVVSDVHPTLYGTVSLSSPEWAEIEATWTGQSGAWTAQVTSVTSSYFVKGEYEIGGETYIKNVAPISAEGGIYCTDGIHKVRPVYNNGTITWEVVQ